MRNSAYRNLLNFKPFLNLFALYLHLTLEKCCQVIENSNILQFEGDWDKL